MKLKTKSLTIITIALLLSGFFLELSQLNGVYAVSSVNHYVNGQNSKVDAVADVGTHGNFTAQQQPPGVVYNDTLTEANTVANTTSSFGNTATTDTSYTTKASLTAIGMNYTTPANAYKLYNITARVKYSASTMTLE